MSKSAIIGILIGLVILTMSAVVLDTAVVLDKISDKSNIKYDIIKIEGMTCIRTYEDSLTCNWDEWEGSD
jgi:hypothetical protein